MLRAAGGCHRFPVEALQSAAGYPTAGPSSVHQMKTDAPFRTAEIYVRAPFWPRARLLLAAAAAGG